MSRSKSIPISEAPFEIHVISNGKMTLRDFAQKAAELEPYVQAFHIREKQLPARAIAEGIRDLTDLGVPLSKIMINDRVDVSHVMGTRGVQLGYNSLEVDEVREKFPQLHVGRSIHSVEEAWIAERMGANFVLYGHIFPTGSKPDLEPRGLDSLEEIVNAVSIPVIAIGGIKPENICSVLETGVKGIAVMSGVLEADNPSERVKSYIIEGAKAWRSH